MTESPNQGGRCRCGAVTVRIEQAPKWVVHCHCGDCRKATGAAFATYAGFDASAVTIEGVVGAYQSSPGSWRRFCAKCGSPVSFEGDRWKDEIHLHIGLLDDPEKYQPTVHVQWAERLPHVPLGDDLRKFDRFVGDG